MPSNKRPKVYAVYSMASSLKPVGGDFISELETLRWMSLECDVFYNGVPFDPASDYAGRDDGEIVDPDASYDLAYIRNNPAVLATAHALGVRTLYFGDHGDVEALSLADAVAAHNIFEAAKVQEISPGIRTFLAEQPGRRNFKPVQDSRMARAFRKRWGDGFTLGFFGRIDQSSFPGTFYASTDVLRHYIRDMNVVFAGKLRWKFELPNDIVHDKTYFMPKEMPHAISACQATIGIEQPEAEYAGSNRVIECIRCEVPILTRPYAARRDQLGDDYPMFFSSQSELIEKIVALRYDEGFSLSVQEHMKSLCDKFDYVAVQKRNSDRLMAWLADLEISSPVHSFESPPDHNRP